MTGERAPGITLAIVGLAVGWEATTFDVAFVSDPVGPKALPLLVAGVLVLAGAREAVRPTRPSWPPGPVGRKIAMAVGAFLAYAVTLEAIGFFLSTTFVVTALAHLYGARVRHGLAAAALLSGLLWLLFVQVLALPLPIGDLWTR